MSKEDIITLEAVGEFPFTFFIEKAVPTEEDEELILEGIASTTNIDHDNERMSKDALRAMEATINKEGVPLRVEHQKDVSAVIGKVYKAWVDERNQLHIRAKLDKSHPVSPVLHHSMKNGVKMGLSVGGVVKRAMKEFAESVGGLVKTFYDVALNEVSVTPRPANYDSWLVAKSIAKDVNDAERYSENLSLRREFLFENSQLDYLQAFAKSVPDKAWRKVESSKDISKDNSMAEIKKESTGSETDTEKSVSRAEFNDLSKAVTDLIGVVSKGFTNVGALLSKAMDGEAKDQANPSKDKPKDESATAKGMETGQKETTNPSKEKADEATQQRAKAQETDTDTTKASETETDTTKASETETETEKKKAAASTDTYDMESVTRSIGVLDSLTKRLQGMKKAEESTETDGTKKATDTETDTTKASETETETTKGVHPLDEFVVKMTKAMEAVVERMEKKGHRTLGFEKSFVEDIQSNPEVQAELLKLLKLPGFKKSVAMGVPYMVTKEGKRFPLVAVSEQVEKSTDAGAKDFKTLYKSKYSSVSEDANE